MSEIRATTFSNAAGTGPAAFTDQWAVRLAGQADMDFVGAAVLKVSNNISSLTDNAVGDVSFTATNAFDSDSYVILGGTGDVNLNSADTVRIRSASCTASLIRFQVSAGATEVDTEYHCISVIGDLA